MRRNFVTLEEALELDKHIDPRHIALWEAEARAEDRERTIHQWMRKTGEPYEHMEVIWEEVCGKHAHDYDYIEEDDPYEMDAELRFEYGATVCHIPYPDGIAGGHEMW